MEEAERGALGIPSLSRVQRSISKAVSGHAGEVLGRDGASIPDELAAKTLHHLRDRSATINIARRQTAREQLALIVDRQMQGEAKEPAHRRFPSFGIGSKDAMLVTMREVCALSRGAYPS